MNREQKRLLQRQGQIGPDGQPIASTRPPARPQPGAGARRGPRTTPFGYLRDVRNELKKVAWPTQAETRNYSMVVIITLAVTIALITALDYVFSEGAIFLFK